MRNNSNAVNRAEVEAAVKTRFSANIQGAKRDRSGDEARSNVEAEMN